MELTFVGVIFRWEGPAPWHFVTVPADHGERLRVAASFFSYGWGMIPVTATIGGTTWTTSMFPKDGTYYLPVKASVRRAEAVAEGDAVHVSLVIGAAGS